MTPPAISVLTLVRGREGHFSRLLQGLARSQVLPLELIVVDMDPGRRVIPPLPYPVRVLRRRAGADLPLAAARNQAAAAARAPLLLLIDVDCIVGARCLSAMQAALAGHDAMLAPEVRYVAGAVADDWTEAALAARASRHPARQFPPLGLLRAWNPGFLWSVAFAIRARSFAALGGFDERYRGYGAEDTDLGFRGNAHGMPLLYHAGAPVYHQHHTLSHPPMAHFAAIVRNATRFHRRWGIWPMQDRLDGFAAAGLLARTPNRLRILRHPTPAEISAARQPDTVLF